MKTNDLNSRFSTRTAYRRRLPALAAGLAGAVLALLGAGGTASGQTVPSLMNYQGKLVDAAGSPMANGSYDVVFKVWKKASPADPADALVWGQTNAVTLVNGIFNIALGGPGGVITSANKTNLMDAFDEANRYLSLTIVRNPSGAVAAPAEMLPRAQMLSAPYALKSAVATGAVNAANGVPPGCILPFGGTSVPSGFLLCNGYAVSRTTYPKLYAAIGNSFGSGDGYNTFNLPDLRGMFLRGVDGGRGQDPDRASRTAQASGGNVGDAVGSYQPDSFYHHKHKDPDQSPRPPAGFEIWQPNLGTRYSPAYGTSDDRGGRNYTSDEGGNETRPKNVDVNYIIKY